MKIWMCVYDDDDLKEFTPEQQEKLNKIMAAEKRKYEDGKKKLIEELEAFKQKASLTAKERSDLDTKLDEMKKELMTKDEQAKHELDKIKKATEASLKEAQQASEIWQKRFMESSINQTLLDAATINKAKNPQHIIALLRPNTSLIEEKDDDGNPTGNFIPKVKFNTVKDGKPITLELPPNDVVKRMSEMDEHINLFTSEGSGGTGNLPRRQGDKELDLKKIAHDPKAYREAKKAGKLGF